jgi:PST family polysaccharide transporter
LEKINNPLSSGIYWTLIFNIFGRIATLLSQLILGKLLFPEDFGVLGLATTVTTLFGVLTSLGIDRVFQQRKSKMHLWATQVFVLTLGFATIVAIVIIIFAPYSAKIYNNEKITDLIRIIAIGMPISALSILPQVKLNSLLRFKFLAAYASAEIIALQLFIILCAWFGMGALSFVLPLPFLAVVRAIVFWRIAPVSMRHIRLSRGWTRIVRRGSSVFGATLLTTFIGQADYVILGLLTSPHIVGIYFFAFRLVSQPMMMLASNFTGVLRPTLISMEGDPARQANTAFKTARVLGLVVIPVCFLQAAVSEAGLKLLFGSRWVDAVPLIQILSIGLPLDAVSWAAGCLLESRGKFYTSLKYQLISAPFFFIFTIFGTVIGGAVGMAIGVASYYFLHPIWLTYIIFTQEKIDKREILACFYIPVMVASLSFGGSYFVSKYVFSNDTLIAQIFLITIAGSTIYVLSIRQWVPILFSDLSERIVGRLKR